MHNTFVKREEADDWVEGNGLVVHVCVGVQVVADGVGDLGTPGAHYCREIAVVPEKEDHVSNLTEHG